MTSNPPAAQAATAASTPETPWPLRVVSQKIGTWIARLGEVWVEGQIAEVSRRPGAGIVFLTLRDPSADISMSVTCRRDAYDVAELREGARVIVRAKPDFYAARGTLSLRASEFRAIGIGELLARLEKLKAALRVEGLFAPERKRTLPFLPHKVGLITGRASAAERDVRQNALRRWPAVQFEVCNVAVQGSTAVPQVLKALAQLDADPEVDVIVLARGGGSLEDLLPFSDEALCRAVFSCTTPVVSAIGHEPDTPIVDFVADVRCSTPTDAGKRVVPDFAEEAQRLVSLRERLHRGVTHRLEREQQWLDAVRSRPVMAQPTVMLDVLEVRTGTATRPVAAPTGTLPRQSRRRADAHPSKNGRTVTTGHFRQRLCDCPHQRWHHRPAPSRCAHQHGAAHSSHRW